MHLNHSGFHKRDGVVMATNGLFALERIGFAVAEQQGAVMVEGEIVVGLVVEGESERKGILLEVEHHVLAVGCVRHVGVEKLLAICGNVIPPFIFKFCEQKYTMSDEKPRGTILCKLIVSVPPISLSTF